MTEWILNPKHVELYSGSGVRANWYLEGELFLDLLFRTSSGPHCPLYEPYFEMARTLTNHHQVACMLDPESQKWALKDLKKHGNYCDVFWIGYSPEELEQFCKESLLPLPPGYKELWKIALERSQNFTSNT